jgi:phospholipid/cholesterol/gamma-HCH transport system ATP-binding protein
MISVRNLWKSFGAQTVLAGINLDIAEGVTTAIVGPSGAGKSVLIKLIMGILEPDGGTITVAGEDVTSLRSEAEKNRFRRRLGVLFQSGALFDSLTVYDNVAFPLVERGELPRREIHERVVAMLQSLSLEDHAKRLPGEVPMGTRKRVGMARALVTEPEIILFDEPNTGLDPLVGQEVYDLILECESKWAFTGVVISHELPEVFQVSDRVAMLLHGKIIAEGTPEELMSSSHPAVQQFLNGRTDGPIKIQ